MQNLIDLRKTPELPPPPEKPLSPTGYNPEERETILSWTAPEYTKKIYTTRWFLAIGGFMLLCILIAIITRNYFFLAFVALASLVTTMYMKRSPRDIAFAIEKEGVYIEQKVFLWNSLKSFWITEKPSERELSLETGKTLIPYLRIPLPEINMDELRIALRKFIPEKKHPELIADEIGKNLGF